MSTRTNNLVALGSAAVVAIYAAGFVQTREAAARFADDGDGRRSGGSNVRPAPAADVRASGASVSPVASVATAETVSDSTDTAVGIVPTTVTAAKPATESVTPTTTPTAAPTTPAVVAAVVVAPPAPLPAAATPVTATTIATDSSAKVAAKDSVVAWKDGVYLGWGGSRHGDIQAEVAIRGGRIVSASIAQCLTRYSCSWIEALPAQVVVRQSPDVDYVSGATQSANAFYYAVVDALSKAR